MTRLSHCGICGETIDYEEGDGWAHRTLDRTHLPEPDDSHVSGPDRSDLPVCTGCNHPEHDEGECEEEVSTGRYGSDGVLVLQWCPCLGPIPAAEPHSVTPDPWLNPDAAAALTPPPF